MKNAHRFGLSIVVVVAVSFALFVEMDAISSKIFVDSGASSDCEDCEDCENSADSEASSDCEDCEHSGDSGGSSECEDCEHSADSEVPVASKTPADSATISSEAQEQMSRAAGRNVQVIDLVEEDGTAVPQSREGLRNLIDAETGDLFAYDEEKGQLQSYLSQEGFSNQTPRKESWAIIAASELANIARSEAHDRLAFQVPADWKTSDETKVIVSDGGGEISQTIVEFREYSGSIMLGNYVKISLDSTTGDFLWLEQNRAPGDAAISDTEPRVSQVTAADIIAAELELEFEEYEASEGELRQWSLPDGSASVLAWDITMVEPGTDHAIAGDVVDANTGEIIELWTSREPIR